MNVNVGSYVALLPTIWALMQHDDNEGGVWETVIDHAIRTSSTSAVKKQSVEFIARVVLVRFFSYPLFLPFSLCTPLSAPNGTRKRHTKRTKRKKTRANREMDLTSP